MFENIKITHIAFKQDKIHDGHYELICRINGVTVVSDIIDHVKGWAKALNQSEEFIVSRIKKQ